MNIKLSTVLWTFVSCLFFGITIGSIGIGAAYPPANLIAAPFVCPNGKMTISTNQENPSSIQEVTTIYYYCVDGKTGVQTDLGLTPALYAGPIYGFIAFLLIIAGMMIVSMRRAAMTINR